jgi:hypothetical protein
MNSDSSDDSASVGHDSTADGADGETDGTGPVLPPRLKSSLLWGVVGGLSFLVLVQGYELLTDRGVAVGVKAGVGFAVALVAAATTHVTRDRLPPKNERD